MTGIGGGITGRIGGYLGPVVCTLSARMRGAEFSVGLAVVSINTAQHETPQRPHEVPQAEDSPSSEDPHNPHNPHKHGGTAPDKGHCTRYAAAHPNRRGALPTVRMQRPNTQEQTRNWHTEPLTAAPLHAQLGPTGGRMGTPPTPPTPPPALQPTPAQSDTSYTLTCEEPVFASVRWVAGLVETWKGRGMPKWPRWRKR